jgi:pimeloyl-ACP methyl ester carboxylesterase
MHALYLHGFGSGPLTAKGVTLGHRLAGAVSSYAIPDLEGGDFTSLTMDGILARAENALAAIPDDGQPVLLIGSSLGGYAAAQLAATGRATRVAALLLIAPAFGFTTRWTERLGPEAIAAWRREGSRPFYHFGTQREVPLGVEFYDSCLALPELPAQAPMPVSIVHGREDESVDHRFSVQYATHREHVELHLVKGDHRLTDQRHETLIAWAALDLLAGIASAPAT